MEKDRAQLESVCQKLRLDLKVWEGQFFKDHGRKPARDEIKANAAIAAKYKEYHKVSDQLSGKATNEQKTPRKEKRKRTEARLPESPAKKPRSNHNTPTKQLAVPSPTAVQQENDLQATPVVEKTCFGPTPQRNGIVLGIFHGLDETPVRPRTALGELDVNIAATPSRSQVVVQKTPSVYEERARGSRTPVSSGKRFMLDMFMTPQKRKPEDQMTPSSSMKHLMTPAFLRRDNYIMSTIGEEAPASPRRMEPWKRRSFGRSLSGMIQDMRREQERERAQKEDEELDLLHELEDEAEGRVPVPKPPKLVVEDSQAAITLDRDGFVPSGDEDSASEEEQPHNGNPPRKPWKKKGLKRQTRRVIMRPTAKKAQPVDADAPEADDEEECVQETQFADDIPSDIEADADAGSEFGGKDAESDEEVKSKARAKGRKPKASTKTQAEKASAQKKEQEGKASAKQKAPRKVKADAHANYRALKIKNKNSKGKGRGRFGRGR